MKTFRTLPEWFDHIGALHLTRNTYDLTRIRPIAEKLALMHFNCPVMMITGTNGKGSCAKTLESIYITAGFHVGLYTSPHILVFNERIQIDGQPIDDESLISALNVIERARGSVPLSFFEFTTLAGLWLFQEANIDVLILEAGLGGRLDAVNIVDHDVGVVTAIDLDHMEMLGHTRSSIAIEKASIARENKVFICGDEDPPTTLFETVQRNKSRLYCIKQDFFYETDCEKMYYHGMHFKELLLPLPALKPQNIATAIAVIEALIVALPISEKMISTGIQRTNWPGRFECIASPPCILDVAHNPQAAAWLATQYQRIAPVKHTIAIVGMLKDKMIAETLLPLLPLVQTWYVCDLTAECPARASDGKEIVDFLCSHNVQCYHFSRPKEAFDAFVKAHCQKTTDRALIFGSFYTVASIKRFLNERNIF